MQSVPTPSASARSKRRSARVQLKIQLVIEVSDSSVLNAETVTVSKHGARIRITSSRGHLAHGEKVRVTVRRGKDSKAARVVWLDKRSDTHYGIELEEPGNFWGVHFPNDGEGRLKRRELRRSLAIPAVSAASHAAPHGAEVTVPEKPEVAEVRRASALIAGISAGRLPFAERVDMVFHHPEEGTALLQTMVEPGATLRLTFGDRVAQGKVMTVGGKREAGKVRVHIKCDAAYA